MSKSMRAKVYCSQVTRNVAQDGSVQTETVHFRPVSKSGNYPADGADEDNTYAKFSPSGHFELTIANPALLGAFTPDPTKRYYVDFTPVE